jgi:hypothetical protein
MFAVCAAALSLAACSDEHATEIKEGAKAAGSEIKHRRPRDRTTPTSRKPARR